MGRSGEVVSILLLAFFVLLGIIHGTTAQYDDYDDYEYEEDDYDYGEDEDEDEYEDEAEDSEDSEVVTEEGEPPQGHVEAQELSPDCNQENCWIRVDWQSLPRTSWMSCLLGYRVTNHSVTIRNLEHQTEYEVCIEAFNPYGAGSCWNQPVLTPPGFLLFTKQTLTH